MAAKSNYTESATLKFETDSEFSSAVGVETSRRRPKRTGSLFTINSKEPGQVLPTAFRTVSHNIDESLKTQSTAEDTSGTNKFRGVTWHSDDITKVADDLDADLVTGLTSSQVQTNLKQYGENSQSKPPNNWLWRIFFYFFGGLGPLLFVGGILVIISYKPLGDPPQTANLALGVVLLAVFIVQALLNCFQDFSSNQVMKSINSMLPLEVNVVRNGQCETLKSQALVPGDLILIEPNTKIPADIRIFESHDLLFDRCILTGETVPCKGKVISSNPNYLESESIAMQGTFCIGGYGKGIVVSTGDNTIFGEIAKLSSTPKKELTTLQKEIFRFVGMLVVVIITLVVLTVILWATWLRKKYPNWINVPTLIVDLVTVAVAFIPEGLPVSLAVCLITTATKMRNSNILCKSLNIVETLGAISVLCTDKTGTLTTGKMTVTEHYGDLNRLALLGVLCNEAELETDGQFSGANQTDQAILNFCLANGTTESDLYGYSLVHKIPFSSKLKYMVKVYKKSEDSKYLLTIKGAPDILMAKAKYYNNQIIDDTLGNQITQKQMEWSGNGQRVILLGSKQLETFDEDQIDIEGLNIEGLVSLSDPLRDQIPEVINDLQTAGIKLVMITGDFEITAKSIARKCGIITTEHIDSIDSLGNGYDDDSDYQGKAVVINGGDMYRLSEVDWDRVTNYNEIVFSRTTPEQKLKIVKEFQKRRHLVGMTGDGVNDSPSIKQADVGIAMADGSEIAKEASDLILLDSFTSIVQALLYGRLVFENVKKTICYLLPAGCYSELWTVLLNVLGGFPQMLSSFNMIIISIVTDCVGSMIISFEGPEKNLLHKKPRCVSGERLVDWRLMLHSYFLLGTLDCFSAMLLSFLNFTRNGVSFSSLRTYGVYADPDRIAQLLARSSSIYFVHLVIMQFFNLMVVRTRTVSFFHNFSWRLLIILPIFASTFIWTNIPAVQSALASDSVPVEYYFISIGFGVILVAYDEIRKLIVRRYPKGLVTRAAW